MRKRLIFAIFVALLPAGALAQDRAPAKTSQSTELLNSVLQEALKQRMQELKPDQNVNDHIIGLQNSGKYNVAVAVIARPAGKFNQSLSHDAITEIYYIVRGSGTQVTGPLADGTPFSVTEVGPSVRSFSPIKNGKATKLGPGDVQIIPPGVGHGWTSIDPGGIQYLNFRIDPDHLLAITK